ncbi:hypothetical protein LF1_00350 [Rubripirellula obstinata]|uniref:Uncharacterized protein n=1 Tax=Rubripirellula obstinata TaxID=406547 RepID=A0A5B1C8S7_9BACT|nr:hypothetical protein [Rubripirellula obstinata]KAA1257548.1 hypothetical protein LF1_00350 [Rubripirellula obstinata]
MLTATLAIAVVFSFARLAGFPGVAVTLGLLYFGAPTVAFLVSRYGRSRVVRYRIALAVMLSAVGIAYTIAAILASPATAFGILPGSFFGWLPQVGAIYAIQAVWKSGLRSAGVDPDAENCLPDDG